MRAIVKLRVVVAWLVLGVLGGSAGAAQIFAGAAEVSITPNKPVLLAGQFHQRLARKVDTPCLANVVALEARTANGAKEMAIIISLDVVSIPASVQHDFRKYVAPKLKGFDIDKLFMAATHNHSAPMLEMGWFENHKDAMQLDEYLPFVYERLAEATVKAWESRKRVGVVGTGACCGGA